MTAIEPSRVGSFTKRWQFAIIYSIGVSTLALLLWIGGK